MTNSVLTKLLPAAFLADLELKFQLNEHPKNLTAATFEAIKYLFKYQAQDFLMTGLVEKDVKAFLKKHYEI